MDKIEFDFSVLTVDEIEQFVDIFVTTYNKLIVDNQ